MQVILANENPSVLEQLKKLLKIHSGITVHSTSDSTEFTSQLNENDYDFAILGSRMQNTNLLEAFKNHQNSIPFIVTSSGIEDAYATFKAGAVDYLLEPLQPEETAESIKRMLNKLNGKKLDTSRSTTPKKRFLVKIGDKLKSIGTDEVAYIYAEGKLIYLVISPSGRKYIIDHKMDELEQGLLDSDYFFRINRKYFIHIKTLEEVRPYVNSRLKIFLNVPCDQDMIVSREKVAKFKRWLNL